MDLVHLDESPKGIGSETGLDGVLRAVWGMLYAHDACIVSRSPQGIAKMISVFVEVLGAFGLAVSKKKTEVMTMPTSHYKKLRTVHHRCLVRIIGK